MRNGKRTIVILMLICAGLVPVCSAKAILRRTKEKYPTALELLDRFAENQNKLQSFVVKAEGQSKGIVNLPPQPYEELAIRFTSEYRFDGDRYSQRSHTFIHNQPSYTSNLWDGNSWYDQSRPEGKLGRVIITARRVPRRDKARLARGKVISVWLGYFYGDDERIDTILREAIKEGRSVSVQEKPERIRGSNCIVINAMTKRGRFSIWLDPEKGYNVVKAISEQRPGDLSYGGAPLKKGDYSYWSLNYMQYKKEGDTWVPQKSESQINGKTSGGYFESVSKCNFTEVILDPDHEALGSFVPDDIQNGARVRISGANGRTFAKSKYTWQDGKVVDDKGQVIFDHKSKKPTGSAESKPKSAVRKRPSSWELLRRYVEQQAKVTVPRSKERIVHFPKDRHLGTLRLQTETGKHMSILDRGFDYEYFGSAKGDVSVPAGKRLILFASQDAWKDFSPLSNLRPDDLYQLLVDGSYSGGPKPGDVCMKHLAGLTGLKQLRLNSTTITYRGLRHVVGLQSLNYLQISSTRLGDRALPYVAKLKQLKTLVLGGSKVTDDGLRHLSGMNSLEEVFLWVNNIRGPGLRHLAELPNLHYLFLKGTNYDGKCKFTEYSLKYLRDIRSLRKLRIWRQLPITDAGMPHLGNLTQLEGLNLYGHPITNAGLAHLKSLNSLKELDLRKTKISSGALIHLKEIKSLEYLKLPSSVTDADMAYLGELDKLKCLHVGIGGGRITDAGLSHVAKLHRLEELSISGKDITDAGMSHIAKLTNLRFLNLWTDQVTNAGLAKLTTLKSLKKLSIYQSSLTTSGLAHLNELPNLTELIVRNIKQDSKPLNISGLVSLKSLRLGFERDLGPRDEDLACLGKLTRLKVLGISPHKGITDKGLQHLAGLTNIWMLSVGSDKVTDDGLAYLANMKGLTNITLSGNFTDKGLRHLEKLEVLAVLDFFSGANFTPRALNQFRKKMPHLSLLRDYGKSQKQRPKSRR